MHLVMFPIVYWVNYAFDCVPYPILLCISYVSFDSAYVPVCIRFVLISISPSLDLDSVIYV
ncbi:hypothetical protein Hdeb2414_s0015g00437411 [Helianthus debilis subsp. tardiflorus]